ncbi:hypothetical protein INR49_003520 [Caranx melampygus]|nr:hypothetical protein INR49_003520 [Caranx melampygus]
MVVEVVEEEEEEERDCADEEMMLNHLHLLCLHPLTFHVSIHFALLQMKPVTSEMQTRDRRSNNNNTVSARADPIQTGVKTEHERIPGVEQTRIRK